MRRAWTRAAAGAAGAFGQEVLDDAVFQRMERHDGETAFGLKHAFGGIESALEFAKLIVHGDAQRLEGARRGMDLSDAPRPSTRSTIVGKLARAGDRARRDDRARDCLRPLLFAVVRRMSASSDFGSVLTRSARVLPAARVHPHVERAVMAEREAALGFVELERRDAEIERDAVGLADAVLREQSLHLGEAAMHQREPAAESLVRASRPRAIASSSRSIA